MGRSERRIRLRHTEWPELSDLFDVRVDSLWKCSFIRFQGVYSPETHGAMVEIYEALDREYVSGSFVLEYILTYAQNPLLDNVYACESGREFLS
jgi:hypothetical protein